jgi:hypothetical protein
MTRCFTSSYTARQVECGPAVIRRRCPLCPCHLCSRPPARSAITRPAGKHRRPGWRQHQRRHHQDHARQETEDPRGARDHVWVDGGSGGHRMRHRMPKPSRCKAAGGRETIGDKQQAHSDVHFMFWISSPASKRTQQEYIMTIASTRPMAPSRRRDLWPHRVNATYGPHRVNATYGPIASTRPMAPSRQRDLWPHRVNATYGPHRVNATYGPIAAPAGRRGSLAP